MFSPLRITLILTAVGLFLLAWIATIPNPVLTQFQTFKVTPGKVQQPYYREQFTSAAETEKAHAASIHRQGEDLVALWYGGSKEGADDVQIFQSRYHAGQWGQAVAILSRESVARDLRRHIRKIGNPVAFEHPNGNIWLFFVSVSVGGWAGSSINLVQSTDQGRSWGRVRKIVSSPFINLSTLVRNQPVMFNDGSIALPVYHEFLAKFSELLRFDEHARVLGKIRLPGSRDALQPVIVPIDQLHGTAMMRYAGPPPRRVMQSTTLDGGNSWTPASKTSLSNPNSAVTAIEIGSGDLIAVINNSVMGRSNLDVVYKREGGDWRVLHTLDSENVSPASHEFEFSYPSIVTDHAGNYHLLYSWNDQNIKHVTFNRDWLWEKIGEHQDDRRS